MAAAELETMLACETAVWQALLTGDAAADAALLEAGFLGVYATGFGDRAEHAAQLAGGPTVAGYRLSEARLLPLAPGVVLLAYRADFTRVGASEEEAMYVSSIWRRDGDGWRNVFSQDTAAGEERPV
ncbi:nuclear transport factor 2 family protein [Tropicimonas sp. IMCC34043]|uniref:nuclear transport factor 2 family protein n=1 Tax=Tropicimonas sp. IMCC34043 TaxID=2248760 RepID=UPI000E262B34|nr:nuclear transport factor 2 family protein [Tropicimonas sp. IMCC34043]